jgi:transcriptional regulator with XRE-family HTH domain
MQLARRCEISTNYISLIETGDRFPSVEMVEKIADALHIQPYSLFFHGKTEKDCPIIPEKIKLDIIKQLDGVIHRY